MTDKLRRLSAKLAVTAAAPLLLVAVTGSSASAAAPSCDAADFTVNGQLDLEGYLACLAGGAPTAGGGGLPTTGSDVARFLAVGAGAAVVGIGALLAAKRDRRAVPAT